MTCGKSASGHLLEVPVFHSALSAKYFSYIFFSYYYLQLTQQVSLHDHVVSSGLVTAARLVLCAQPCQQACMSLLARFARVNYLQTQLAGVPLPMLAWTCTSIPDAS